MPRLLDRAAASPNASWRFTAHALVLAMMAALVLAGVFSPPSSSAPLAAVRGGGGPAAEAPPAPPAWLAALPAADATATGAILVQAESTASTSATPRPRLALPAWLRSTVETGLWSGPDERAVFFTSVPSTAYVQPLGPYLDGRLLVFYAGDGGSRAPGPAWVDARDLEPSPPPAWAGSDPAVVRLGATEAPALRALPAPPRRVGNTAPPAVTAHHVAIVDEASGSLLYGEQANAHVAPASTTKILTTILALEQGRSLQQTVPVTVSASEMVARDGSSTMGLEPGEQVKLETLLYGMMLPSGNDAAEQVALSVGGSREQFVRLMNQKVAQLGLKDSHFANPSGMDADDHYSSAFDMAMLGRYAMRNETFRKMAGAVYYYGDGYTLKNLNRLIGYYAGADGIKIGFTDAARRTIVASATRDGHRVYVSLMRSEDLVGDCAALFDWVWETFSW